MRAGIRHKSRISHQARKVLKGQELEVVRAKHAKEIAVTNDPERKIAFGDDKVTLREVEEWLSEKAKTGSRWASITGVTAVAAAFIGLLAFLVAAWQAWISNDTEQRTLRAYVGVVDHRIENVALDSAPRVQMVIKNFGSTPASNVTYWIASKFERYPHPIALPAQPFKPDKFVLFPSDGFTATFDIGKLNQVDMAGLNDGSRLLYVYGEIDYWDALTMHRCTKFRLMYGGLAMLKIDRMALAENGNEIDELCQN